MSIGRRLSIDSFGDFADRFARRPRSKWAGRDPAWAELARTSGGARAAIRVILNKRNLFIVWTPSGGGLGRST
jgi:hypothetical protein